MVHNSYSIVHVTVLLMKINMNRVRDYYCTESLTHQFLILRLLKKKLFSKIEWPPADIFKMSVTGFGNVISTLFK